MLHFHIVTLFPDAIRPYLDASMLGKAQEKRKIKISYYNPKDFVYPRRGRGVGKAARTQDERVDRRPYGGGPGMVLRPEPLLRAVQKAMSRCHLDMRGRRKAEVIFFATDGKQFDEAMAAMFACASQTCTRRAHKHTASSTGTKHIVLICGHYEGVDARVQKILKAKKVSVGPYVLTGGELPAATLVDAIARFVPGVLGKAESLEASRVSSPEVYTRPEVLAWKGKKYRVPKVLLSGHHSKIDAWKKGRRS